jgi:hypothetical protein
MKRAIVFFAILLIVAVAAFIALRLRSTAETHNGVAAESKGDYAKALSDYTDALYKTIPSAAMPDVNRSKILSPEAWKKEIAQYASWLYGTSAASRDRAK